MLLFLGGRAEISVSMPLSSLNEQVKEVVPPISSSWKKNLGKPAMGRLRLVLGLCVVLLSHRELSTAQRDTGQVFMVDAAGGVEVEGEDGMSRLQKALGRGKLRDAAYLASSFCRDLGLKYRYHFEQQCPSKVMRHALGEAGAGLHGEEGARAAKVAVEVLLEDCRQRQIEVRVRGARRRSAANIAAFARS